VAFEVEGAAAGKKLAHRVDNEAVGSRDLGGDGVDDDAVAISVTNTTADVFALTASSGTTITLGSTGTGSFVNNGSMLVNGAGTVHVTAPLILAVRARYSSPTPVLLGSVLVTIC